MTNQGFRTNILSSFGATDSEIEELLEYNQSVFDHASLHYPIKFPLPDEPFVATWQKYAAETGSLQESSPLWGEDKGEGNVFNYLKSKLVQLRFPIKEGISQTEDYRAATRKGVSTDDMSEATGLTLQRPERLQLILQQTPAGRIPILITGHREDFVALLQALTMRNEPRPVPASMGATTVAGFNNWDRIHRYREQWEVRNSPDCSEEKWQEEFRRLIPQKELYQDRFVTLSDGPYSGVPAEAMSLSEKEWRRLSLTIRREHECAHYFTRRMFGSMKNNLIDELIADHIGIVAAAGRYRADWFLRFVGLELFPRYREGGRLQNYRGELSAGAFEILQALVKNAAENLERFDARHSEEIHTNKGKALILMGLTCLTLEELASKEAYSLLQQISNNTRENMVLQCRN